ncbi:MAG: hypothetical protein M1358_21330 [Chloroflexi bacterium]|nr:hypothetical protein [Chloroflexota bacterium]
MLRNVQTYTINAHYRDLLNHLFRSGERSPFGNRMRVFRDKRPRDVCECTLFDTACIGHAACLTSAVELDMGVNWQNTTGYDRHAVAKDGVRLRRDVYSTTGFFITLDQKRKDECVSALWLEQDSRLWLSGLCVEIEPGKWLGPRLLRTPVRLEDIQDVSDKLPTWLPTLPGDLAQGFCQEVWRQIIDEWEANQDAYLKRLGSEGRAAEERPQEALVLSVQVPQPEFEGADHETRTQQDLLPKCWSFRQRLIVAMKKLVDKDEHADLGQQQMADAMGLSFPYVRELSAEHKNCCGFDWKKDVRERGLLEGQ